MEISNWNHDSITNILRIETFTNCTKNEHYELLIYILYKNYGDLVKKDKLKSNNIKTDDSTNNNNNNNNNNDYQQPYSLLNFNKDYDNPFPVLIDYYDDELKIFSGPCTFNISEQRSNSSKVSMIYNMEVEKE
jgi:hypothetical protein